MVENPSKALEELRERFAGFERMHAGYACQRFGQERAQHMARHREWMLLGEFCPEFWPSPPADDDDGAEI